MNVRVIKKLKIPWFRLLWPWWFWSATLFCYLSIYKIIYAYMSMTSMEQCKNYYADGSNRYYVVIFGN